MSCLWERNELDLPLQYLSTQQLEGWELEVPESQSIRFLNGPTCQSEHLLGSLEFQVTRQGLLKISSVGSGSSFFSSWPWVIQPYLWLLCQSHVISKWVWNALNVFQSFCTNTSPAFFSSFFSGACLGNKKRDPGTGAFARTDKLLPLLCSPQSWAPA